MTDDVHGMQELLGKLEKAGTLMQQKTAIVRALRDAAEPIRQRAEELAPFETGKLREQMMATVYDQTATGATAKIGPSRKAFYGMFQEFGTANVSAQAFLRPAFDALENDALKIMSDRLAEEIEKLVS